MLSTYETLALLTALVAAVTSFVALYRTSKVAKRQLELQEAQAGFAKFQHEILAKEQSAKHQADIRVRLIQRGGVYRVVIENRGPGRAKDVIFEEFVPDGFQSPIIPSEADSLFPIPSLLPNEEVSMPASVHMGTALQFAVRASWFDHEGKRHEQFCQVSA